MMGAPIGAIISRKMNVRLLRYALALLIAVTAVKIWIDILG